MLTLIRKELRLALHPTAWIFLALSAMLLIPGYPFYVVFFYTGLSVFFTCLAGRESNDVFYSLTLPISRAEVVKGRFAVAVLQQLAQMLLTALFAVLRGRLGIGPNLAGMDANVALFGLSFAMLGIFNLSFFRVYYRSVVSVGKAFAWASVWVFLYIIIAEGLCFVLPFFRDVLDTPDPANMGAKLTVLIAGGAAYALMTLAAYRRAVRDFERQEL